MLKNFCRKQPSYDKNFVRIHRHSDKRKNDVNTEKNAKKKPKNARFLGTCYKSVSACEKPRAETLFVKK